MIHKTKQKPKKEFLLAEYLFPLSLRPDFITKRMFGCLACYLGEKLVLVLAENKKDPVWNGVLYPVERQNHEAIQKEFAELKPHSILPKWLFLGRREKKFEFLLIKTIEQIAKNDLRFGTISQKKRGQKRARKS